MSLSLYAPMQGSMHKERERMSETDTPEVLSVGDQVMIVAWLLLFGGRWGLVPLLTAAGGLTSAQVSIWDETALLRIYLIMVSISILVLALRILRSRRLREKRESVQESEFAGSPGPACSKSGQTSEGVDIRD